MDDLTRSLKEDAAALHEQGYVDVAKNALRAADEIERLMGALAHVLIAFHEPGHIPRAEARRKYGHLCAAPVERPQGEK